MNYLVTVVGYIRRLARNFLHANFCK